MSELRGFITSITAQSYPDEYATVGGTRHVMRSAQPEVTITMRVSNVVDLHGLQEGEVMLIPASRIMPPAAAQEAVTPSKAISPGGERAGIW